MKYLPGILLILGCALFVASVLVQWRSNKWL